MHIVYNMHQFFGTDGIKRHFVTEDIYDKDLKTTLSNFIDKINKQLEIIYEINNVGLIIIVDTIEEMHNYKYPRSGLLFWVKDATSDNTVNSGGAAYISTILNNELVYDKVVEAESLDVSLDWNRFSNIPNSSIIEIDNTVNCKHNHYDFIDNISTVSNGNLEFNNVELKIYTGIDYRSDINEPGEFTGRIMCSIEKFDVENIPPR